MYIHEMCVASYLCYHFFFQTLNKVKARHDTTEIVAQPQGIAHEGHNEKESDGGNGKEKDFGIAEKRQ